MFKGKLSVVPFIRTSLYREAAVWQSLIVRSQQIISGLGCLLVLIRRQGWGCNYVDDDINGIVCFLIATYCGHFWIIRRQFFVVPIWVYFWKDMYNWWGYMNYESFDKIISLIENYLNLNFTRWMLKRLKSFQFAFQSMGQLELLDQGVSNSKKILATSKIRHDPHPCHSF